jgi:hypothetical protein
MGICIGRDRERLCQHHAIPGWHHDHGGRHHDRGDLHHGHKGIGRHHCLVRRLLGLHGRHSDCRGCLRGGRDRRARSYVAVALDRRDRTQQERCSTSRKRQNPRELKGKPGGRRRARGKSVRQRQEDHRGRDRRQPKAKEHGEGQGKQDATGTEPGMKTQEGRELAVTGLGKPPLDGPEKGAESGQLGGSTGSGGLRGSTMQTLRRVSEKAEGTARTH